MSREKNTFQDVAFSSKVTLQRCVEILQHSVEDRKCALLYFRPEMEIEHFCAQAKRFSLVSEKKIDKLGGDNWALFV
jgi:hypothetical protein